MWRAGPETRHLDMAQLQRVVSKIIDQFGGVRTRPDVESMVANTVEEQLGSPQLGEVLITEPQVLKLLAAKRWRRVSKHPLTDA